MRRVDCYLEFQRLSIVDMKVSLVRIKYYNWFIINYYSKNILNLLLHITKYIYIYIDYFCRVSVKMF